jgi:ATP-dependent Zn protease
MRIRMQQRDGAVLLQDIHALTQCACSPAARARAPMLQADKCGFAMQYDGAALSPETRTLVENEVHTLVDAAYARAKALLVSNEDKLHKLANELLKEETLSGEQIGRLLGLPAKAAAAVRPGQGFTKL